MSKSTIRLLCALMCAVMLLGLMPSVTASALETVTTTEKVPVSEEISDGVYTCTEQEITRTHVLRETPTERPARSVPVQAKSITQNGAYYYFETFAELQTLAKGTYTDYVYFVYSGTNPLVISADLILPDYAILYVEGTVRIPAGVSFLALGVLINDLIIDGEMGCYTTEVVSTLTVNGTLYNYDVIYIEADTVVKGAENIVYDTDECMLYIWYYISDMTGLRAAVSAAESAEDTRWFYELVIDETNLTITESITLPGNSELAVKGVTLTVNSGCTLGLNCYAWIYGGLVVNGTLNNDGVLDIYYDDGGKLTIASGGKYSGGGYIFVDSNTLSDPAAAVPGLTGYSANFYEDPIYGNYWLLTVSSGTTQLNQPTDLGWGYDYTSYRQVPGYISWKNSVPDSGMYQITVFRNNQIYDTYYWSFNAASTAQWHSIDNFCNSDPEDGSYFFTVTALGDNQFYTNSPAALSETWYYTRPTAKLGVCTNLKLNGDEMTWDKPADTTYLDGYEMELYYSATADGEPVYAGSSWSRDAVGEIYSYDWTGYSNGEGYYYFRVRLLSSNINQACNGDWSKLSNAYYYDPDSVDNEEDSSPVTFQSYEWEVLKLVNQERLAAGLEPLTAFKLLQDASYIRAEELNDLFDHTRPDGTACFTALDEVGLSYRSAGENIASGFQTPAAVMNGWMNSSGHRANILSENFSHIGIGFNNYNWVQMFIGSSSYTSISVLLPENASVAPGTTIDEMNLAAALESSTYGTCYLPVTEAYCTGYDPDQLGTQQVTISVLGVSTTFEITVSDLKGDLNGDGMVDDVDVAQLLWYTLFGEEYGISGNADFNGDGKVNDADVAYLLWHTLFPDSYPL